MNAKITPDKLLIGGVMLSLLIGIGVYVVSHDLYQDSPGVIPPKTQVTSELRYPEQETKARKHSDDRSDSVSDLQSTTEIPTLSEQQKSGVGEPNISPQDLDNAGKARPIPPHVVESSKHVLEWQQDLDEHRKKISVHRAVGDELIKHLLSSTADLIASMPPEERKEVIDAIESQLSHLSANMDAEEAARIREKVWIYFANLDIENSRQTGTTQEQVISDWEELAPRVNKWAEEATELSKEAPEPPP